MELDKHHLIIGSKADPHTRLIENKLKALGQRVYIFDFQEFPTKTKLSICPCSYQVVLEFADGNTVSSQSIQSIYIRTLENPKLPVDIEPDVNTFCTAESRYLLQSFLKSCTEAKWVNPWHCYNDHKQKPFQLFQAQEVGAKIPKTIVSNSPTQILEFKSRLDRDASLIFKPVYGGSKTELVLPNQLEFEWLEKSLQYCPITIQEFIPGTNVRTYIIGEKLFNITLESSNVDFREDLTTKIYKTPLPHNMRELATTISRKFGLRWAAIDWRFDNKDYYFLEINPSPMFTTLEKKAAIPISDALTDLMISRNN